MQESTGVPCSGDVLAFVIPCLQFVQLNTIGVLYASDLLVLLVFLWFACQRRLQLSTRNSRTLIALGSLWLLSQCVTDLVRNTEFVDYSRGWSKIVMTLVIFSVLYTLLYGQPRRIMLFGWGLVAGSVLTFFVTPSEFAVGDPWKFGLAYPVALATYLLCSREHCQEYLQVAVSAVLGLISIYLGSRSRGGVCLAVALYLLIISLWRGKHTRIVAIRAKSLLIALPAIALAAVSVFGLYLYAADSGILGQTAKAEYEDQSAGDYGVLLGGRSAILGSIPAIYDSPILGHGSWARDPIYVLAQLEAMAAMGYENTSEIQNEELEEGYVPAHSYLFGAWVEAGIVGAIFWGWVWVLVVKGLLRVYPFNIVLLPLLAFCGFSLAWDILFSPYGAEMRIIVPYYLVILMTHLGMAPLKVASIATATTDGSLDVGLAASSDPRPSVSF